MPPILKPSVDLLGELLGAPGVNEILHQLKL